MFSQACVILFTGERCIKDAPSMYSLRWLHPPDVPTQFTPLDAPPRCTPSPVQWMHHPTPGEKTDGQQAVGTHPSGMHSRRFWSLHRIFIWRKNRWNWCKWCPQNLTTDRSYSSLTTYRHYFNILIRYILCNILLLIFFHVKCNEDIDLAR